MSECKCQGICTVVDPTVRHDDGVLRSSAALLDKTTWDVKQIPVAFMNGPQFYQDEVAKWVKEWEKYANIEFVFVGDQNAPVRVSFEPPFSPQGQFNSVIGNMAKLVPTSQPTVNLGFLPNTAEDEFSRLILHEFGHALGLIHEHQSPKSGMRFLIPQVFEYFAQFGWDQQMVQSNILDRYSTAEVHNATAFDPDSIMLYPFPASIAVPPSGINRVLSEMDKQFVAFLYPGRNVTPPTPVVQPSPKPTLPGIPLTIGLAANGFLVISGSRILYNFHVADPGSYTVETTGEGAWVLSVYSSTELSKPIATDRDGSGRGLNAKVVANLNVGDYFAAVSPLVPDMTGAFGIVVGKA